MKQNASQHLLLNGRDDAKGYNVCYRFSEVHRLGVELKTVDHYTLSQRFDRLLYIATVARNEISWFQNLTPILVVCNLLTGQDGT